MDYRRTLKVMVGIRKSTVMWPTFPDDDPNELREMILQIASIWKLSSPQ
jgi:hypothetical protein